MKKLSILLLLLPFFAEAQPVNPIISGGTSSGGTGGSATNVGVSAAGGLLTTITNGSADFTIVLQPSAVGAVTASNALAAFSATTATSSRYISPTRDTNLFGISFYGDSILAGIDAATRNSPCIQTIQQGAHALFLTQQTYTHDGYSGVLSGTWPGMSSIVITEAAKGATNADQYKYTAVVMIGHNDGWTGAWPAGNITNQIATNIAWYAQTFSNYLVLPILRDTDWTNTSIEYQNITNFNNYLATVYGDHFVDYYPSYYMATNDATDSAQVTGLKSIPWKYYNVPAAGYIHMTDTGYSIMASNIVEGLRRINRSTPVPASALIKPNESASIYTAPVIYATSNLLSGTGAGLTPYGGLDVSSGFDPGIVFGGDANADTRTTGQTKVGYMVAAPKTTGAYPQAILGVYSDGATGLLSIGGGNAAGAAPQTQVRIFAGTDGTAVGAGNQVVTVTNGGVFVNGSLQSTGTITGLSFVGGGLGITSLDGGAIQNGTVGTNAMTAAAYAAFIGGGSGTVTLTNTTQPVGVITGAGAGTAFGVGTNTSGLGGGTTYSNITENGYITTVRSNLVVTANQTNTGNIVASAGIFSVSVTAGTGLVQLSDGGVGINSGASTYNASAGDQLHRAPVSEIISFDSDNNGNGLFIVKQGTAAFSGGTTNLTIDRSGITTVRSNIVAGGSFTATNGFSGNGVNFIMPPTNYPSANDNVILTKGTNASGAIITAYGTASGGTATNTYWSQVGATDVWTNRDGGVMDYSGTGAIWRPDGVDNSTEIVSGANNVSTLHNLNVYDNGVTTLIHSNHITTDYLTVNTSATYAAMNIGTANATNFNIAGSSSGLVTLQAQAAASGTLTLPNGSATLATTTDVSNATNAPSYVTQSTRTNQLTVGWPAAFTYYTVTNTCALTNVTGATANKMLSGVMFLTNSSASTYPIYLPSTWKTTDGQRAYYITNGAAGTLSVQTIGTSVVNASYAPLY